MRSSLVGIQLIDLVATSRSATSSRTTSPIPPRSPRARGHLASTNRARAARRDGRRRSGSGRPAASQAAKKRPSSLLFGASPVCSASTSSTKKATTRRDRPSRRVRARRQLHLPSAPPTSLAAARSPIAGAGSLRRAPGVASAVPRGRANRRSQLAMFDGDPQTQPDQDRSGYAFNRAPHPRTLQHVPDAVEESRIDDHPAK